jgi:hypothetical protein
MKITIAQITVGAVVAALILFIASSVWMLFFLEPPVDPTLRLEYLKFSLELYKAIGVGFLITLLTATIPQILPEARYSFENSKEGREIYSQAKTGAEYLPYKLPDLDFKTGIEYLEKIHRLKHLADCYPQLPHARDWLKNKGYYTIVAYRNALVQQNDWDTLSHTERLAILTNIKITDS